METTHFNLTAEVVQFMSADPDSYMVDNRWLAFLPFYHMYGAMIFLFLSRKLSSISAVNVYGVFIPRTFWIVEHQVPARFFKKHRSRARRVINLFAGHDGREKGRKRLMTRR